MSTLQQFFLNEQGKYDTYDGVFQYICVRTPLIKSSACPLMGQANVPSMDKSGITSLGMSGAPSGAYVIWHPLQ